jgi:hypothetical protein
MSLYISLAFSLALSILIYLGFRNIAPTFARISLSFGGAIAGSFITVALFLVLFASFRDGGKNFGLFISGVQIFGLGGGIAGLLAALRWTAQTNAGRRKLNIALCATPLLALVVLFGLPPLLAFALHDPRGDTMHERSITVDEFTASPKSVAFVIPTPKDVGIRALVFVDRATRQAWRIGENAYSYEQPRLSWDGERLLFVRKKKASRQHELVSCLVGTWQCRVVVRSDNDVRSPVEIDKDLVVYSSSPLVTAGDRSSYIRYELYSVKIGSGPIQISNYPLIALHSINVVDDKILFGAVTPVRTTDLYAPRSEIFEWPIDRTTLRVSTPVEAFKPLFFSDGFSVYPSASRDGRKIAFLNTELGKGSYRFNLMVVDRASGSRKLITLDGKNFSRAAFAEDQMLYNELLNDRYTVKAWNSSANIIDDVFEIEFSKLESLPQITLSLPSDGSAGVR